jgi:hypothetical protein
MRLFVLLSLLAFALPVSAAQFSSLEEKMSEQEFHDAGLDKLSPEELERLNAWLSAKLGAQMASPGSSGSAGNVGFRPADFGVAAGETRSGISSRTVGSFSGWEPGSIIDLENGQTWKVIDSSSQLAIPSTMNAIINIDPGTLGSWLMKAEGYNISARVTRVK